MSIEHTTFEVELEKVLVCGNFLSEDTQIEKDWLRTVLRLLHRADGNNQGNLIQGKAQQALKNLKNLFGDQWEDSLTSLEVCYLL